jgi:hypothetical protein
MCSKLNKENYTKRDFDNLEIIYAKRLSPNYVEVIIDFIFLLKRLYFNLILGKNQ